MITSFAHPQTQLGSSRGVQLPHRRPPRVRVPARCNERSWEPLWPSWAAKPRSSLGAHGDPMGVSGGPAEARSAGTASGGVSTLEW